MLGLFEERQRHSEVVVLPRLQHCSLVLPLRLWCVVPVVVSLSEVRIEKSLWKQVRSSWAGMTASLR